MQSYLYNKYKSNTINNSVLASTRNTYHNSIQYHSIQYHMRQCSHSITPTASHILLYSCEIYYTTIVSTTLYYTILYHITTVSLENMPRG